MNNNNFNNYQYNYQYPRPQKLNNRKNNKTKNKNNSQRTVYSPNNPNNKKRINETNKKPTKEISNKKREIEIIVPEFVTKTIQIKNILFYIGQFLTSKDLLVFLLVNKRCLEILKPVLQQKFQEIRRLTNTLTLNANIDELEKYIHTKKSSLTSACYVSLNNYLNFFNYFLIEHEKEHPDCMNTLKPLFNNQITYQGENFKLPHIKTLISHHDIILKFFSEKKSAFFDRLTIGYLNKFLNLLTITYKVENYQDEAEKNHNKITDALYNFCHNIMTCLKDEKNLLSIIIKKHTLPFIEFLEQAHSEILSLQASVVNKPKLTILMCLLFSLKILHIGLIKSQQKLEKSEKQLNQEKKKLKKNNKTPSIDNPKLKTYNNNLAVYQEKKKIYEEKLNYLKKAIKPFDPTNCIDDFVKWAIIGDTKSSSKGTTYTLPATNTALYEEALEIIRLETLETELVNGNQN